MADTSGEGVFIYGSTASPATKYGHMLATSPPSLPQYFTKCPQLTHRKADFLPIYSQEQFFISLSNCTEPGMTKRWIQEVIVTNVIHLPLYFCFGLWMEYELIYMYYIHSSYKTRDPSLYELSQTESQVHDTERHRLHQLQKNPSKTKANVALNHRWQT